MKIEITMKDYVTIETAMAMFLIERKAEDPSHEYVKHLEDSLERFKNAHWDAMLEDAIYEMDDAISSLEIAIDNIEGII